MDRWHYISKYGWEAMTTLSLAVVGASLIGMLLTQQVSAKLGVTVLSISVMTLGLSLTFRASLQLKEDNHE